MFAAIETIKQNCRRCYTCVRSCPAKAIRIEDGQASVLVERCIACGRCTTMCSQNAKTYASGVELAMSLLKTDLPVAALLAPSFPAEFLGVSPGKVAGALRAVGFRYVVEVAAGADEVATAYRELLDSDSQGPWIATACPAVIELVRKYHPALVSRLSPVVSPMIATARTVKRIHGEEVRCVFIGPCVAKKLEVRDPLVPAVVEEALTFAELRRILEKCNIDLKCVRESGFDPPWAAEGRAFPLEGGLFASAGLSVDILDNRFLVATGRRETEEALADLEAGRITPVLAELLLCHGCHEGPGMTAASPRYTRRANVCEYAGKARFPGGGDCRDVQLASLERGFVADDQRLPGPSDDELRRILARTNKFTAEDELNCGACGYVTCRAKATAVFNGLAEEAMCLPFVIDQAERVCHELHVPWRDLREIHRQLVSTEKLASLGQLAAGIAHELNNPLGTILLYTGLLDRKLGPMSSVAQDLKLVADETQRCKRIVSGLLDFARQNRTNFVKCRIDVLIRDLLEKSFDRRSLLANGTSLVFESPPEGITAEVDRDQLTQLLVNLVGNGLEALDDGVGEVKVSLGSVPERERVLIVVRDTGCGIPSEEHERIFQPFFTTKSLGRGTGLGLPIAYGIVKMHRGSIWFESDVGMGTAFFIELPLNQAQRQGA